MTKKELEARVAQLEAEITSLKERVGALESRPTLPTYPVWIEPLLWQPAPQPPTFPHYPTWGVETFSASDTTEWLMS